MATLPSVVLQGKAKWAFLTRPDNYGKWSMVLYPTPESLEKFKAMKLMNHLKKDDDGYYFKLARPTHKEFKRGTREALAPPRVVDKEGADYLGAIGNGSDVKVELEYYSWPDPHSNNTKYGARIVRVKIMELVPYTKDNMTKEDLAAEGRMAATDASLAF